jgi:acyl-CoA dehydrogenase
MAKYWCSEKQTETVDECLQLHGGYGYVEEFPIARMFVDGASRRFAAAPMRS